MRGLVLTIAACMMASQLAGCSRSDDGSVTMADPLHVGRYLRAQPSPPATPPVQSGLQVFPISPAAESAARVQTSRATSSRKNRRRSAAAASATPDAPLACRDAVTTDGRVHVACE